jgi:hypothetical protein
MAEHGEWNRKGATLSDVNAEKEYGITEVDPIGWTETGVT